MYDATAAELIANPTFPVEMYIVEHLACVIPHAAICAHLIREHHNYVTSPGDSAILCAAAQAMTTSEGQSLALHTGCTAFFKEYLHHIKDKRHFDAARVYRIIATKLSDATEALFEMVSAIGGRRRPISSSLIPREKVWMKGVTLRRDPSCTRLWNICATLPD